MPDESRAAKKGDAIKIAMLVGALVGALLARPIIKPWLDDAHGTGYTFKDWPILVSFLPWVAFSMYWEWQSKNSAPAIRSESKASRTVHVVLTNLALLLIFWPSKYLSQRFLPDNLTVRVLGLAAEVAGVALAIWARRILGRNWSGEITIKQDHELIRTGPYGSVRHPIYSGLLGMYAGTAIVSGQMHALLGLLLGIIAYLRKTRMEEQNLVNAFGSKYESYRQETAALVPGLY
ncbi:methyltransferase family protein [Occallatibacter savannae]|uniref:methyltransferase family protein n=1 Tax=Occallatibacter savannae TaxID=1002691 RepID=UPI000D694D79|nr:isoprenylcysteine carboxylmethyltransferase family protein [Occallatibacter savannae]